MTIRLTAKNKSGIAVVMLASAVFVAVVVVVPSDPILLRWRFVEGDTFSYQVLTEQPSGIKRERVDYLIRVESVGLDGVPVLSMTRMGIAIETDEVKYDSRDGGLAPEDSLVQLLIESIGTRKDFSLTSQGQLVIPGETSGSEQALSEAHHGLHLPIIAYCGERNAEACGFIELPHNRVAEGAKWESKVVEVSAVSPPAAIRRKYTLRSVSGGVARIEGSDEYLSGNHIDLGRELGKRIVHNHMLTAEFIVSEGRPTSIQFEKVVSIDGEVRTTTRYSMRSLEQTKR